MNLNILGLLRFRRRLIVAFVLALAGLPMPLAQAAPKYGNSLDWAPADAAFYSASLRLREQIEIIARSNAWAKLTNLPAVQMGLQFAKLALHQPGGPLEQLHDFFSVPENRELHDLVLDGLSSEIVCYGDSHAADFVDVLLRTLNAVQYGSMIADLHSRGGRDEDVTTRIFLNALDARRDRLETPGLVLAFKLTDAARAQSQLKRLETLVKPMLDEEPLLKGRLKHASVGGTDYLTLELDGRMVPWQEVPWERLATRPGQYDQLRAKLMNLKLIISAGIRSDYLVVAIGNSTESLAALGAGKLLADLPELQAVAKYSKERLVGISYVSKSMLQALSNTSRDLDELVQLARQALPEAGLSEEMNKRLAKDAEELAGDIKTAVPELGAHVAFSFLTSRGIEGYAYDWSQNLYWDASKPLDLLDHVGGNPLLVAAGRTKYSPQQYEMVRKWAGKAFGYFEELAMPHFSAEEKQQFSKFKEIALPLLARLDKATGQMLLPALADGQSAVVLDAKLTSKRWFEGMPESDQALPMLEAALVFGVSDTELLKKACAEYRSVADAVVEKLKEFHPKEVPADFKLPPAESKDITIGDISGAIYWYKLPDEIGIDSQLTPNAGLTQKVAVLSLAPKHTIRLLSKTPLMATAGGPLADRNKPLASAVYFSWTGLVDAVTPWIDFAVNQFAPNPAGAGAAFLLADDSARSQLALATNNQAGNPVLDQVHTVLEVLKSLRTIESATYQENGAMVTHSLSVIQDLP